MKFSVQVLVMLKPDLLDPQGKAVERAMKDLGLLGVEETKVGKVIRFKLESKSKEEAEERVREIARTLLSNPVIEDFEVEVREL
jgi:phosphoribosylformylglycinamidine synthase